VSVPAALAASGAAAAGPLPFAPLEEAEIDSVQQIGSPAPAP
jgi:hypothetical protein